jgi:hypothetical protein
LFFGDGVELFGRGDAASDGEEIFVAVAPLLAAEFIEAEAYCGAIEPCLGLRGMRSRSAPEANESFDGELFGASWIAHDSAMTRATRSNRARKSDSMSKDGSAGVAPSRTASLGAFTFI